MPRWRELPARWGWVALVFAATTLPYLPKSQPAADPLRFSLPGASWLLLLGAAGLTLLVPALRRDAAGTAKRAFGLALALAAVAFASPSSPAERFDRPWAWEREYAFLRAHLPAEPGAAHSGWYDASQDPNGAFALWMQLRTGLPWRAWGSGHPEPGDLVVRGTADRLSGGWAGATCGLDPLQEENVAPSPTDGWISGRMPCRSRSTRYATAPALDGFFVRSVTDGDATPLDPRADCDSVGGTPGRDR